MRKRLRHLYVYLSVRVLSTVVSSVSRSTATGIGSLAGLLIYLAIPGQSRKALENLRIAYGTSKDARELKRMARRVFIQLGRNLVDVLRLPLVRKENLDSLVSVRGLDKFEKAMAKGRGLIAISGHLGCWELIPAFFSLRGYPVSVVGRRVYDSRIDTIVRSFRSGKDIGLVSDSNIQEALKCLRNGRALGLLIDERANHSGIPVDFFKGKSRVTRGPAVLSMRAGAPVVPLGIHRGDRGKHIIEIGDPMYFEGSADAKRDVPQYARICSKAVEALIRKHPMEWVWMHDKFET
ncbi:MAG: lysophospholipid acyltransferase family protein [bacterium]